MDTGKLRLDEIVGPAEAFFSVRNFASLRKGIFRRKILHALERKKIGFIQHYLHCIVKLFILEKSFALKITFHFKKILELKIFFH
jgi:hypothetical protein